jgi:hypothetical protein
MGNINKTVASILTLLLALSTVGLLTAEPAKAQSTPSNLTPSIPEFTIKYVNNSHYTQPTTTTTTDPYTGQQTVTTTPSSYVQEEYLEVKIKNMTYTPYPLGASNYTSDIWFNVRYKGHYSSEWTYVNPNPFENYSAQYTYVQTYYNHVPTGDVDYQVQAINGYQTHSSPNMFPQSWVVEGQAGGWSDIQTIKLPDGTVTITPYTNLMPTQTIATTQTQNPIAAPTPTVPEIPASTILILLFGLISVALMVRKRKTVNTSKT